MDDGVVVLTGLFDSDADSIDADVVHFFDSSGSGRSLLVFDEGVATLEGELGHGAELFELILEIIRVDLAFETTDVDLGIC